MTPPARPPTDREMARVRQQRYRERVRDGRRVVPVAVDLAMLEDALTVAGYLNGADDRAALEVALEMAVKDWIDQRLADAWADDVNGAHEAVTRNE
jgi:hypothetical protein